MNAALVPVLEIGGTHVVAALVDPASGHVAGARRSALDSRGSRAEILHALVRAASELTVSPGSRWGVAIPGPFDYEAGIGRFHGVGKFDALNGVDMRALLLRSVPSVPASVAFLNDADAFGLGEVAAGAAHGAERVVCLTVGTGVGSAFIASGAPVNAGPLVPPAGSAHLLEWDGRPLEDAVSRRALIRRWHAVTGTATDVDGIAHLALSGDARARHLFRDAMDVLGRVIGPWAVRFGADVVVVGGSISRSWELIEPALRHGLDAAGAGVPLRRARDTERSALIGTAAWATRC